MNKQNTNTAYYVNLILVNLFLAAFIIRVIFDKKTNYSLRNRTFSKKELII